MRFEKPKITPFTYQDLLSMLKANTDSSLALALKLSISNSDPVQRTKVFIEFLKTTPFSSYFIAMRNFQSCVNRYELTGDKNDVKTYISNLTDMEFDVVRKNLLSSMLEPQLDDTKAGAYSVMNDLLYQLAWNTSKTLEEAIDPSFNQERYNNDRKRLIIMLAEKKWPEAKNLQVLHG